MSKVLSDPMADLISDPELAKDHLSKIFVASFEEAVSDGLSRGEALEVARQQTKRTLSESCELKDLNIGDVLRDAQCLALEKLDKDASLSVSLEVI